VATTIHWLDSGGSAEITAPTFGVRAQQGTAPVLETDSDLLPLTNSGRTIADGQQATVRLVTADGGYAWNEPVGDDDARDVEVDPNRFG
jgi:hypothetical protein